MKPGKRVVVADINSFCKGGSLTGHACAVAENYRDIFREKADVRIAGGPAFLKKIPDAISLGHNVESSASPLMKKLRVLHNMWNLFRRCKEDIIVLQSSAVATAFFGIAFFKFRRTPLYMIQYNAEGLNSPVKRFLHRLAKRKINGVICPDAEIGKAYGVPYCVVPDYIYTGGTSSDLVPYEEKKYDFCMVGIISRDKGMIEAAAKLADTSHRVIIAGRPCSAEIEQELRAAAQNASNIELRLRYLDDEEYADIIRYSRYGILNYSGAYSEHSSGVVFDLLFRGLPIIGRYCKSLQFIAAYGMGQLVCGMNEWDVSTLPDEQTYQSYQANISRYYLTHERSRECLCSFVLSDTGH